MKFEENFPSLKSNIENHRLWIAINKEYMKETCLDKNKVKEAIEKFTKSLYNLDTTGEFEPDNVVDFINSILYKELKI